MKNDSRWSNLGLWLSIASLLYLVLSDFGIIITPEKYSLYIETISSILLMAGIISNPKDGKFYLDTK